MEKARVLLKARPTEAQLADRLAKPAPAGLELYLAAEDLADRDHLDVLARRLIEIKPDPGFAYVVEGPLRSLDGAFFDVSVDNPANRECLRRVAHLAGAIGAEAILIHAITPMGIERPLSRELHAAKLEASLALLGRYVEIAESHRLIPLVENIPPVARMREGAYMSSIVGMSADDLTYLGDRHPALRFAVDLSHAGLFLNGLRVDPKAVPPALALLARYLEGLEDSPDLEDFLAPLEPRLYEIHVSNARGLLEEGQPYDEGDLDLDSVARRLAFSARYMVTETLEPDPDRAVQMRVAQRRLEAALGALASPGRSGLPPDQAAASGTPRRNGGDRAPVKGLDAVGATPRKSRASEGRP